MIAPVGEIRVVDSGAELRVTGSGPDAVVCVNGGGRAEVPGTWSSTVEWLVERLAPRFPGLRFGEVRYRIKSWRRLDLCAEDGAAAIASLAPRRTLMLGFSMGGSVSVRLAAEPSVAAVVGLAPWLPEQLDLSPLEGKRLAIVHGTLDSAAARHPRRDGEELSPRVRARRRRGESTRRTPSYAAGSTAPAVRSPWGRTVALPRARAWLDAIADELARFEEGGP